MKILMVNKFLYPNGGSETYIFKLGEELVRQGHQVEYFGMEHKDNIVGNSINTYTETMDFHNSGAVKKLKLSLKTIYSKEARNKIRLVLNDFKPDVVHLNNFNYQLTPSVILEVRKWEKESGSKVKIIYTAHDYQLICPNHMLNNPNTNENCEKCIGGNFINCTKGKCVHGSTLKSAIGTLESIYWNKRNTYNQIDKIICCSEFMKSMLDTNPVFKNKTAALHNFIQIENTTAYDKEDYILYFGRFAEEKGIKALIEVCKAMPDTHFIFAGSGPLEDEINKISNIKNVGFKTGEELNELIGKAKFSIYPSLWYENCPFSVMESISLGTPVIGSKIGGIPELIEEGKTGLLFEAGNTNDFKNTITKLINDNNLYENICKNCTPDCFLNLEEYSDKYFEIINN